MNEENAKAGVKVTPLAFLMKAVVAALKKFPTFNSSLDGENLILKQYWHIGFAADTPNGLVVPVIKDADKKGVIDIAQGNRRARRQGARRASSGPPTCRAATFSISSLGGIGGTAFTPIVNAPEVAILGVSKAAMKPVWDGKQFAPRTHAAAVALLRPPRRSTARSAARFTTLPRAGHRRHAPRRSLGRHGPIEIKVPDIGDFKDIPVIEILVKPGDTVEEGGLARHAGERQGDDGGAVVARGHGEGDRVKIGDKVSQGTVILLLDAAEGAAAPAPAAKPQPRRPRRPRAAAAEQQLRRRRRRPPRGSARARRPCARRSATLASLDSDLHAEVLVLGAGPGGYTAAFRAADLGKKVVLVERYPRSAASA